MAGVKISNLPAVPGAPQLTDIIPEVQPPVGGVTYKVTLNQLLTLFQANIQITESQVTNLTTDLAAKVNRSGDTMTGFLILNADPVTALGAATKQYVDAIASGLNILAACYAASTTALTVTYSNGVAGVGATLTNAGAQATFSIDSVTPPLNSRILIKNQASTLQNGIYTVTNVGSGATNWVLTRATDYNTPAQINPGDFVLIDFGTVNTATAWIETATITTIGTDPILFSQFGAAFPLAVASGGTGATTAAGARTNLGAAASGTNSDITSLTGLTGVIRAPTFISSSTGLPVLGFNYVASAVNYLAVQNAPTGNPVTLEATGTDTIIQIQFAAKGGISTFYDVLNTASGTIRIQNAAQTHFTGLTVATNQSTNIDFTLPSVDGSANFIMKTNGSGVLSLQNGSQIPGTATNDNATTGNIGEYVESVIASGSPVTLTNNSNVDVTSISLTAGDWDVWGNVSLTNIGTTQQSILAWVSSTSATLVDASLYSGIALTAAGGVISTGCGAIAPQRRFSLSTTTTIYLTARSSATSGNATGCGRICARRRR